MNVVQPGFAASVLSAGKCAFGDLPPPPLKYYAKLPLIVEEKAFQISDREESEDCSWEDVYRLYGCTLAFA